jgi:hypothetical protein
MTSARVDTGDISRHEGEDRAAWPVVAGPLALSDLSKRLFGVPFVGEAE